MTSSDWIITWLINIQVVAVLSTVAKIGDRVERIARRQSTLSSICRRGIDFCRKSLRLCRQCVYRALVPFNPFIFIRYPSPNPDTFVISFPHRARTGSVASSWRVPVMPSCQNQMISNRPHFGRQINASRHSICSCGKFWIISWPVFVSYVSQRSVWSEITSRNLPHWT